MSWYDPFLGAKACNVDPRAYGTVYHPKNCPHRREARRQGHKGKRAIIYNDRTERREMTAGTGKDNSFTIIVTMEARP
jgi:hypothetical protein